MAAIEASEHSGQPYWRYCICSQCGDKGKCYETGPKKISFTVGVTTKACQECSTALYLTSLDAHRAMWNVCWHLKRCISFKILSELSLPS